LIIITNNRQQRHKEGELLALTLSNETPSSLTLHASAILPLSSVILTNLLFESHTNSLEIEGRDTKGAIHVLCGQHPGDTLKGYRWSSHTTITRKGIETISVLDVVTKRMRH
jgi:hypothetical protein